ncbi:MAG: histidine kinase dimerization/phospho-acceptor domain-containing protein, partial [Verrucomicrobiota bacterium]
MANRHPSFRLRIALLTSGITGLILIICGSLAWMLLYRQLEKSVDLAIGDPGRLLAHRLHAESDWAELEQFWDRVFGGQTEWDQLILIKTNTGEFVFSTSNAAGFPLDRLDPYLPEDGSFADAELMRKHAPGWRDGRSGRSSRFLGTSSGDRDRERDRRRPTRRSKPPSFWVDLEDRPRFFAIQNDGIRWRMGAFSNPDVTVFVGANLADFDADVRQSRSYFLLALPIGLLATAGLGWLISRQATNPVARISLTASQMTARGLGQRIPLRGNETAEFAQLIQAFNQMMERLERGFHQATRFTADASHELKTPIALMQAELEDSLNQVEPNSPTEQSLLHLQSEVQRLKGITQRLLLLSQADAG